ncbi:putative glycosyltransferase EpsH [termite gut metagenome]|uniref:Putative glycosyltransferase EpsH n=1 Tax=termite gut metagenome TaxID=433724 RepID=A0A5J4S0F9_9ZZZZ
MEKSPKVSVIIPIYKVESYIERCACSLFEQTLDDIEYIFVNDCTPDSSMTILFDVIEQYPRRKPQIQIIHHDVNKGLPTARNSGLKIAVGEYIIHCDSDDWVEKDMYESLYNKAVEEDADIVGCDYFYEYINKSVYTKLLFGQNENKCFQKMLSINGIYGNTWNRLVKKNIYTDNNIRFPEEISMCEDIVATLQLHYFAKKISYIPKAFYHYTQYHMNSITKCVNQQQLEDMLQSCQIIESFLHQHHIYEQYYKLFMERVFKYKQNMILIKSLRDFEHWHTIWPESNQLQLIWHYTIPLKMKIIFSLVKYKLYSIVIYLLEMKLRMNYSAACSEVSNKN